ncbi:hypothetical protein ACTQ1U_15180 [Thermoguttaceae bacterium LCP21S3_D4]|nr:hypothetical protein [Lachnospiraceae bacterium]
MELRFCFIKKEYFEERSNYIKMLDAGNADKQSRRTHLCIQIRKDNNNYYIPLRNNLGDEVRKFGRIGHAVPSAKRKNAGLDYRYALIVNDESYLEEQTEKKIPESQYRKIAADFDIITKEFENYLSGYIKAVKKKRHLKEPLFKESSLINFINILDEQSH